ncbi:MAG TPA: GxxExxY protein [Vicinamibacterales bacterium]|jgi:GxxExxY protein
MTLTRVTSTLSAALETLINETIGCCVAVHRELGPGLSESAYSRACCIELAFRGIQFETERSVVVRYRNSIVCQQRIDLFIDRALVVEVKAVERIHPVHVAQVVSYLRATGVRAGLVVNFNVPLLKQGIRRVVL